MSDLSKSTMGTDRDLTEFLRKHPLDDVYAIDGVVEILRGPLPPGWRPTSIQVELVRDEEYPLDPQATQLLTPYKNKLAGLGWETKHRVAALEPPSNRNPVLRVAFAPTTYEEGTGFHRSLVEATANGDDSVLELRKQLVNQILRLGRYSVPGVAVVHTLVTTSDNILVLCQRSPHAGYHPSVWSLSFEEQVNQKDLVFGNAALSAASIRGFQEEFASGYGMIPDDASVLGVFLEYGILNIGFCVHIKASLSLAEIKSNWETRARDKWEAVKVVGEPFTLDNVIKLLRLNHYGETREQANRFHPTSKYRLMLAAISEFGSDLVVNAIESQ